MCDPCPIGTYQAEPGAVAEDQCLPCPEGTFAGSEGATQCDSCASGSYVTLVSLEADGLGTSLGGEACVACPAGRESTAADSIQCTACAPGESSAAGEPCTSW